MFEFHTGNHQHISKRFLLLEQAVVPKKKYFEHYSGIFTTKIPTTKNTTTKNVHKNVQNVYISMFKIY